MPNVVALQQPRLSRALRHPRRSTCTACLLAFGFLALAIEACESSSGSQPALDGGGPGPFADAAMDSSVELGPDSSTDVPDSSAGTMDSSVDASSLTDAGGSDAGPLATKGDPYILAPSSRTVVPVAVFSSSGSVTDPANVLSNKPTTLTGAGAQLVLDFGKEVGGILSLEFASASGNESLGVAFSESSLYVGPNSDNSAGGSASDGALAVSVTGPGSWTSEAKHLRGGFRYLTLFMKSSGSVDISGVSLAFSPDPERAIPNQYPNYFYSNDELLNKAWYSGAYTVQTNIVLNHQGRTPPAPSANWDNSATVGESGNVVLVDGAKRDRTVWAGDMGIAVPTGYVSLFDTEAAKNSLVTLFNHQHPDGHLNWSGPPWNLDPSSDTYHLWTLHGTYLTYLYSGDKTWLDSVWTKYKTAITYITGKIDGTGLLDVTGTADWGPRVDQGGKNIEANSLLHAVLVGGAALADAEGDGALASNYTTLAASVKAQVNAQLWDSSVGAYKDNPGSTLHPQDGNALAVWFGVADDASKGKGLSYVHNSNWNAIGSVTPEWGQISTFVGSMELMSHFVAGYDKRGLDMIRTMWGFMLSNPNGPQSTFWESFTSDGTFASNGNGPDPSASFTSLAHGWATGPTSALTFYVLGVAPDTVQGQSYHVIPHPGDLTHVEGKLTFLPGHFVQVAYDVGASCKSFSLSVDARTHTASTGVIAVPRFGGNHSVTIGGAVAWNGTSFVASKGVAAAHQDDSYIYFTGVQPGAYLVAYTDGTSCGPVPEQWSFCANEDDTCTVSGTKRVRYGRDGKYKYKLVAGSVVCDSTAFGGDPIDGTVKLCHFSDELYTSCAVEGETCTFDGTKEVRFGANGQWKTVMATGGALCSTATFGGDPLPDVAKTCEYR
jgi:hypothetical protein